jgi:hypothetical protein
MTMKRDLTRELQVLDRLPVPDMLEDAERRALGPGRDPGPDLDPTRRWLAVVSLGVVAVGVAIGGFVWLNSAFRTAPRPPAQPTGPNYVFSNVRPDDLHTDREDNILVRFEVSWSEGSHPGIHRCVFRALDAEGEVVSERVDRWFSSEPSRNAALDIPAPSSPAVTAEAGCDPERLDTPGVAHVVPLDPAETGRDLESWLEALEPRVEGWAVRFDVGSMSVEQLAANIAALTDPSAYRRFGSVNEEGWASTELRMRAERLCRLIPEGHPARRGLC